MIKLPDTVDVLSHIYKVITKTREEMEGLHGTVKFESMEIWLAEDLQGNFARETLLHEVMHIIDYYTAGADAQVKERDIQRLSAVLYDTMMRNPLLMKRIFETRT